MNNQPENVRGADGIGAGAGNGVGNGAGIGNGGLAGMSLGVSSVSAKKRAEREAAQAKASEPDVGGADSASAAAIPQLDPRDPLAPLWQLDGVAHAADVAAKAIQAVHRHKANLRKHNVTGSESVLRGARASAWLEGGEPSLPDDGNITDPVLAAALRVADTISPESIGETTRVWQRAPQQVLAKFALNASPAGETEDGSEARMKAGRPVGDDKLSSAMKEQRLHVLGDFITGRSQIHAGVLSAIVHGELLTLRPFEYHNGIIARAASRLTTVATGLDPRGLAVPEVYWTRHRQEYFEAAEGFASGSADGLRAWILLHLEGLKAGAVEARGIAEAV